MNSEISEPLSELEKTIRENHVKTHAIAISHWIREYASNAKIQSLVVGISGGIDSALVSTLCAMTGLHTHFVSMPIHQPSDQLERAESHMYWLSQKFLWTHFHTINLTGVYDSFENLFSKLSHREFQNELGFSNSRARLRMTTLYQVATAKNGIVVGTGNKVEDFGVGFYTKYGDGGVDISPIADLTKTEVFEMATVLGIIPSILNAKPTDGLWEDDRSDEDQLGASYTELEWAMDYISQWPDISPKSICDLTDREQEVLKIYNTLHRKNLHKMLPIPVYAQDKS